MCCLRVCKGNFPLRIRRKTPRPPCFRRPFGAGSCSGICRAICAKRGWRFLVASRAKVSLYLSPRGREFFGCRQGKGVSLPTAEGMGVFWLQEGRGCLSTYRRRGMEFFGCRRGKGVLLPTAEGAGSFLVARGARVSSFLPPWGGDGVFWLQAERGCLSAYHRGAGAEKRPPAGGMGGGGLLRAYNWSAADTIRTHLDGETNSPYPKPYNTPY